MHERAFVLKPLLELEPELRIPGRGEVRALVAACADQAVERIP
jgi:2-amino-4-hydroxy-6-hydroxymethyldihydropteridine diphosphokinase